jgi:hypothetical protein
MAGRAASFNCRPAAGAEFPLVNGTSIMGLRRFATRVALEAARPIEPGGKIDTTDRLRGGRLHRGSEAHRALRRPCWLGGRPARRPKPRPWQLRPFLPLARGRADDRGAARRGGHGPGPLAPSLRGPRRKPGDAATYASALPQTGLLRCARNDGGGNFTAGGALGRPLDSAYVSSRSGAGVAAVLAALFLCACPRALLAQDQPTPAQPPPDPLEQAPLDPSAPLDPLPDLGVDWPQMEEGTETGIAEAPGGRHRRRVGGAALFGPDRRSGRRRRSGAPAAIRLPLDARAEPQGGRQRGADRPPGARGCRPPRRAASGSRLLRRAGAHPSRGVAGRRNGDRDSRSRAGTGPREPQL